METLRNITFCCTLVICSLGFLGCGKKADETKPLSEVKAEADKMSIDKLRSMAMKYKDAILSKKGEVERLAAKLKDIPVAKMMGDEAKGLKAEIEAMNKSVSALKERFQVYYDKLKGKGGNLSGLEL